MAKNEQEFPERKKVPVEVDGITVRVYPDIGDEFGFFKLMVAVDEGSQKAELDAISYLFGDELANLENALFKKHGIIRTSDIGAVFYGVLGQLAKNSASS